MQAAVLKTFGSPLVVETLPDPVLGTGEVIVDVVAAPVLSYADEVFSGARKYLLPLPVVLGCGAIGRVREVGPDATRLAPGDWVFCDPTVRSRDDALMPDITREPETAPAGYDTSGCVSASNFRCSLGRYSSYYQLRPTLLTHNGL